MALCRYYKGKYTEFCKQQNSEDPMCTKYGGDYYGPGKPAGCYREAAKLEEIANKNSDNSNEIRT